MSLSRRWLVAAGILLPLAGRASDLWAALRAGGVVLLMRHAQTTPGVGDPPGFRLDDCATQRNLNEIGRAQAVAWGDALRREGVAVERVLSSTWCRCQETAELMRLGPVETFAPLNSFFEDRSRAAASRAGIHAFVADWRGPGIAVLVSHQVNVTGAYGIAPRSGEALVIEPDLNGGRVLGTLPAPEG